MWHSPRPQKLPTWSNPRATALVPERSRLPGCRRSLLRRSRTARRHWTRWAVAYFEVEQPVHRLVQARRLGSGLQLHAPIARGRIVILATSLELIRLAAVASHGLST